MTSTTLIPLVAVDVFEATARIDARAGDDCVEAAYALGHQPHRPLGASAVGEVGQLEVDVCRRLDPVHHDWPSTGRQARRRR
ncbi:MAG: hypothetical protein WKF82_05500 [Nocardioidaceae bacterium]